MDITCGTLSSLVDKFRDLVIDLTWEQLRYLFQYHRNIEELNERHEELTLERSSKQQQIDNARNNLEQIEEKVQHWLRKVDEILEQTQMFHDEESQAKTECSVTSCHNLWLRYKLSKRAKAMALQVAEIYGKRNFDRISYPVPPLSMPELFNRESNEGIGSRVQIVNQIIEELRNPSVNMIGLCGLGGVGKTTIAKEVETKAKNQNMFEKVIMATVSNELNVKKIQDQIAEKLGLQLNEKCEEVRACRLCKRLKLEKNMLLILDDLWEELDLGKVGIPFVDVGSYSEKNEGCKILLTSRNKTLLLNCMKCQEIIEVDVLSEDEAWKLFKRISELPLDSSNLDNLISIAYQIVQKCGRLPLAIVTAAKALRGKNLDECKDYLARWTNHLRRNNTGIKEVDSSLKLSYDPLSLENKTIFLLSAMLSHDPSIDDLLMYSMGLDILQGIGNIEEAHVGITTIVRKLKSLNLFLDGFSSHHFTIHDVFRDVALSIAPNELNAFIVRHRSLKEWPNKEKLEGYKGICLQKSDINDLPEELHGPRLEFFLLDSAKRVLAIPMMFFKSSKELKVLAFTNVHFSSLPSLMFLQKLKTLCLHSCLLEDIIEVRSLKKLEVLSLAYSEIQQLPIELAELTSLQMLNLAHCSKLKVIPPKLLSSFKKLEVLHMENSFDRWKVEGSTEANENASLNELMGLPICSLDIHIPDVSMLSENLFLDMNLMRYKILIGKHWVWNVNYESSKILKLELETNVHLKPGVQKLMKEAEYLSLCGSNGLETILHGHYGRGFPHLRHLQIVSNDTIRYFVLNSAYHEVAFPILESLKLGNLNALEKLCQGPNAGLCAKDRATNNECNNIFKSLFNKAFLPKLEILELTKLNHLIPLIWDDQLSHNSFSNLKTLTVIWCGFVKLVPLHVLKSLNNLEELEVNNCDMLETVFDFEDLGGYKEMESSLVVVPLKKLKLTNLPKLKNVWSDHRQGIVSFQHLRSVHVSYCESLTSLFPAFVAKGMLHDLEDLEISNCKIDGIVGKDQVSEFVVAAFEFPRLTFLKLCDLPNLRNFYPQGHTLELPRLQRLYIQVCDQLEIFKKEASSSSEIHEEESTLDSKCPLLSINKVIHDLELTLWGKAAEMIGNGQFPEHQFPKVKLLHLCVDNETIISNKSSLKYFPNLEELKLQGEFKEASGGDDLAAHIPKLTLNNISNMRSVGPSLVSSPNLTYLHVTCCHRLATLMTSSTVRNLVHLARLSIGFCDQITEIITKQEGEGDEDKGEIFFNKLELLELDVLPRLKIFCGHNYTFRFPLLECVTITMCPQLTMFCPGAIHTPQLQSIQLNHQEVWDTNLNKAFQQRFVEARELVLDEYDAAMIRNDQFPVDRCPRVKILHIEGFVDEWVTVPYTLLERFPRLNTLHVEDSSFEEIFPSNADTANLYQLNNMWRDVEKCCNLIKLAPSSTSLHNLTMLEVSRCHQFVYLMTNSTAKSLVNLATLEINDCKRMEKIVMNETNEDVEGGITFNGLRILKLTDLPRLKTAEDKRDFNIEGKATNIGCRNIFRSLFGHNKVLLPKLEILKLCNLNRSIPLIWDDQLSYDSFRNLKTLIVESCGFVKLVPLHVLKCLNNLEELEVRSSDMLEMVFDFEDLNDYKEIVSLSVVVPMKKLKLRKLTKLKNVWNNRCHEAMRLASPNLTHLDVAGSNGLTNLITLSTARSLVHLTCLSISSCDQIEEIITKQEGEDDEDKEIFFNKLEFLRLHNLPRLKRFYGHNCSFRFPLLKDVIITECPQLEMFCLGAIHTPRLQRVRVADLCQLHKDIWMTNLSNTIQHRFTIQEVISIVKSLALNVISTARSLALNAKNITMIMDVFPLVKTLYVESFKDEGVTFPYSSLERFPKLHRLHVEHSSFEEIFPSQDQTINFTEKIPPFKQLHIAHLVQLKSIWNEDSQLLPIHQDLTLIRVKSCCNLIKLAPSSASFENLIDLSMSKCHRLIHLVTSSTAKSLVNLETLEINDCENMEEIVKETNEDAEGRITFKRLWSIKLIDMPSLKMFSSRRHNFKFPELEEIQISGCPQMKKFCRGVLETPKLSKVKIEEYDMEWKDEEDLNKTIEMLSLAKDRDNI